LAFGDSEGLSLISQVVPDENLIGIVGAEIRPQYLEQLSKITSNLNIPLLVQPRHKSPDYSDFVAQVQSLTPDLILVNSYSMLLRPDILSIPSMGAVNIHGALLPQYRGCNPTQWALLNNETETGVTMHYMDAKFDTGDIIAQRRVPILFTDTWRDIQERSNRAIESMLQDEMPGLLAGTNNRIPQDESRANYNKRRHPEDGKIDWDESVLKTYNLIRALVKPHPGAFYFNGSEKIILDEYLPLPQVVSKKYENGKGQMKGKNLGITPLTLEDLPGAADLISKPGEIFYKVQLDRVQKDLLDVWFKNARENNESLYFCIRPAELDEIIGICQLHGIDHEAGSTELYISLLDSVSQREAHLFESAFLLLNFAFRELALDHVNMNILSKYQETIRTFCEKGFRKVDSHENVRIDDKVMDVIRLSISRGDYQDREIF
jgi:methionyl-tRNA formyltransferase